MITKTEILSVLKELRLQSIFMMRSFNMRDIGSKLHTDVNNILDRTDEIIEKLENEIKNENPDTKRKS
jgi:hypothetical protein